MWRNAGWWMRPCCLRRGDLDRVGRTPTVTRVIGTGARRSLRLPSLWLTRGKPRLSCTIHTGCLPGNAPRCWLRFVSKRSPLSLLKVSMKFSRALLLRVATHVAAWIPFLTAVAGMLHAEWRAVGDGARIALGSWEALTAHGPLVGPGTQVGPHLYDPGPLEFWLLAVPVHLDPVRGVFWGAALWGMVAGSLAVEAMWAVLGEIGGALAGGTIVWALAWRPEIAAKPYWNPWFATMFFLAALTAGWAVLSGRRWWWPVLVITASVAAQAHLMFALASAGLILLAFLVGMADASRAGTGFRWAVAGLAAGLACWVAPVIQQVAGPGRGNLAALLHGQAMGHRTGLGFALKTLTAAVQPPPIWWLFSPPGMNIEGRSAAFAVAVLAVTAAALLASVFWLRSRVLARVAALSVLASAAVLVTFSRIPLESDKLLRLWYLATTLFPVGLLVWLTIGAAFVVTGRRLISQLPSLLPGTLAPRGRRPLEAARAWARPPGRFAAVTAAALIVAASWLGVVPRVPSSMMQNSRATRCEVAAASANFIEIGPGPRSIETAQAHTLAFVSMNPTAGHTFEDK